MNILHYNYYHKEVTEKRIPSFIKHLSNFSDFPFSSEEITHYMNECKNVEIGDEEMKVRVIKVYNKIKEFQDRMNEYAII